MDVPLIIPWTGRLVEEGGGVLACLSRRGVWWSGDFADLSCAYGKDLLTAETLPPRLGAQSSKRLHGLRCCVIICTKQCCAAQVWGVWAVASTRRPERDSSTFAA